MVYNYTVPRAPIAAMYSSPGPCYALPGLVGQKKHDPRSEHHRGASYTFGLRPGIWTTECSPGPCYFPSSKMYRDGKDGTPHYSLSGRQRKLKSFPVPGPGAYKPEKAGPSAKPMPPAYSFGVRHKQARTDQTPAANAYTYPPLLGKTKESGKPQAPCYSLTGRKKIGGFHEDLQKTPGPGAYNTTHPNTYMNRQPQYSMTGRSLLPDDLTQKPGPGAHSPEKVTVNKRSIPASTFGIRHSQYLAPFIVC